MNPSDGQKKLDILSSRLSTDSNYARLFMKDFEFAKSESSKFGFDINVDLYQQLCDCYSQVQANSFDFETFEDDWQNAVYKHRKSDTARLSKIIIFSCILGASIGGLLLLKKFLKGIA